MSAFYSSSLQKLSTLLLRIRINSDFDHAKQWDIKWAISFSHNFWQESFFMFPLCPKNRKFWGEMGRGRGRWKWRFVPVERILLGRLRRRQEGEGKIMHNHCMQHFAHEGGTLVPQYLKSKFQKLNLSQSVLKLGANITYR